MESGYFASCSHTDYHSFVENPRDYFAPLLCYTALSQVEWFRFVSPNPPRDDFGDSP